MDSALGLAFNIGYNLTSKFSLSADFDFLEPDYTAILANDPSNTQTIRHSLSQFIGRFKGTLNLMEGPFSPFVEVDVSGDGADPQLASVRLEYGWRF
jgi:hypothetical protein